MLARRAFNVVGARVRAMRVAPQPGSSLQADMELLAASGTSAAFDTWRHAQVVRACGKDGLRLCSQLDFNAVKGHFLWLIGEDGHALNAHMRAETEQRRQFEHLIVIACTRWGFHLSYAENLCRSIHRVNLNDADARVLRLVMITVNARGAAKAKKQRKQYASN